MDLYSTLGNLPQNTPFITQAQGSTSIQKNIETLIKSSFDKPNKEELFQQRVQDQIILLDNPVPLKKEEKKLRRNSKKLSSKERNRLKLFRIEKKNQKYEHFIPLHELWKQYIDETTQNQSGITLEIRLLKADYHGALMKVIRAKCPSLINLSGIMIQETSQSFKIITSENKIKVVPKTNCVFTVTLGTSSKIITLYGNQFCFRSFERTVKKFKPKSTIEIK